MKPPSGIAWKKKSYVCEYMDEAVGQGSIAFKETLKRTHTYTPL